MKILIGYDGSECADVALEDLRSTGLPKSGEALVMSLADVILPPSVDQETFPSYVPDEVRLAQERAECELKEAESLSRRASEIVKKILPEWQVTYKVLADSPAWALIRTADERNADLIIVGAQGHSVLGGRLILGSVSQRVLYEASCSVRVARSRLRQPNVPLRLLVGADNSDFSNAAVDAVARREWPNGTQVRLLTVVDTVMPIASDPSQPAIMKWVGTEDENNWDQIRETFQPLVDKLRSVGLHAELTIRRGNPKDEIVEEAESWEADCIFVGAKGLRGIDRLLLGSVSSAVSARAHCSVEVVRPERSGSPRI